MTAEPSAATAAGPWRYHPGDLIAVAGGEVCLVLPGEERASAAAVWPLLDRGAALGDVLDVLLTGGLAAVPDLAAVSWLPGGRATVLVRGTALRVEAATADGPVVVDAAAVTTWSERSLDGVRAVAVRGDAPVDGEPRPLEGGLVRAAGVERGVPTVLPSAAPAPPAAAPGEADLEVAPSAPAAPGPLDDPGETGPYVVAARTPLAPPVPEPPSMPVEPPQPTTPPPVGDPLGEETGHHPGPGADHDTDQDAGLDPDHDGQTRAGVDQDAHARPPVGLAGQPQPPQHLARPVAVLEISNGDVVEVDRVVVLGRAPEARRFSATEQPRLVTVPSPLHEISSTHLEVRPGAGADHGSAVVTDLGSTNGTVLTQPGLGPEELSPGIAVQLIPGAEINLGDGVTIRVRRP